MLAGAGLGAAAVQGLHAQAKPVAYVISEIDVTDKDAYAREYVPLAVKALKASGQSRVSFCRVLRTWRRRKPRIRIQNSWMPGKSAINTPNSEFSWSKA